MRLEDGQAVQLEDGTTAFIHHTSKGKLTLEIGRREECKKSKTCLYLLKCCHVKDLYLFSEIQDGGFGHILRKNFVII